jgi:hypothetical protein
MSIRFKVTIPKGSLLEQELTGMEGKARNNRLYFLAELGAQSIQNSAGNTAPVSPIQDVKSETSRPQKLDQGTVQFPMDDLMQLGN